MQLMLLLLSLESLLLPHDLLHSVFSPFPCEPSLVGGRTGSLMTLDACTKTIKTGYTHV